jgi:hypothetical protein
MSAPVSKSSAYVPTTPALLLLPSKLTFSVRPFLQLSNPLAKPCPACPSNSDPICGRGQCSCQCREGYFSVRPFPFPLSLSSLTSFPLSYVQQDPNLGCLPLETCTSTSGTLRPRRNGSTSCACSSPFVRNSRIGGCTLPPSIRARRFARQLSQTPLAVSQCPGVNERVCPLNGGSKGAFECLDVSQALESCGACPGEEGSVNCLTEVEGAENVACVKGECVVCAFFLCSFFSPLLFCFVCDCTDGLFSGTASCFPGYRYLKGRCVRSAGLA